MWRCALGVPRRGCIVGLLAGGLQAIGLLWQHALAQNFCQCWLELWLRCHQWQWQMANECDVVMSAGGTAAAPPCQVHGYAGCWQTAPVSNPTRAYRALARRTRQCSQLRWFHVRGRHGGGAVVPFMATRVAGGRHLSVTRRATAQRAIAAHSCQRPGVRALRASTRPIAPVLATALFKASMMMVSSAVRAAGNGVATRRLRERWSLLDHQGHSGVGRFGVRARRAIAMARQRLRRWWPSLGHRYGTCSQLVQLQWWWLRARRGNEREAGTAMRVACARGRAMRHAGWRPRRLPAWQQRRQQQG